MPYKNKSVNEYHREYYAKNVERMREYNSNYRRKHPERVKSQQKKWRENNPAKVLENARKYNNAHKDKIAIRLLRKTFGTEVVDSAPTKPEICDVCGRTPTNKGLHFDHCHKTGKFRGWLCHHCNIGLGNAKDDPAICRAWADYLERNK